MRFYTVGVSDFAFHHESEVGVPESAQVNGSYPPNRRFFAVRRVRRQERSHSVLPYKSTWLRLLPLLTGLATDPGYPTPYTADFEEGGGKQRTHKPLLMGDLSNRPAGPAVKVLPGGLTKRNEESA